MARWDLAVRAARQKAIADGDETYQGSPCKWGHPGVRLTKYNGKCLDCHKEGRRHYWKNHEKLAHVRRSNPRLYLLRGAQARAKEFKREFSLKEEDIRIPEHCPVSGCKLEPGTCDGPSIDRIDNNRGYTPDNIWVISKRINRAKSNCSLEELEALVVHLRAHALLA